MASDKYFTDQTNTNTIFFNSVLLKGLKLQIEISSNSYSFYKIQSLISVALSTGITFLVRAVCFPSPHDTNVGKNTLRDQLKECLFVTQGAGTTFLC